MKKDLFIICGIVSLLVSIVCYFINWKIATGIILGTAFSLLYFYVLNLSFKMNEDGTLNRGSALLGVVRILIIAMPLFIAFMLPNVFNFFGAFAGVMIFRIIMMIVFFIKKGEK